MHKKQNPMSDVTCRDHLRTGAGAEEQYLVVFAGASLPKEASLANALVTFLPTTSFHQIEGLSEMLALKQIIFKIVYCDVTMEPSFGLQVVFEDALSQHASHILWFSYNSY